MPGGCQRGPRGWGSLLRSVTARLEGAEQHPPGGSPVEAWDVLSKRGLFPGEGVPKIMGTARAGVGV